MKRIQEFIKNMKGKKKAVLIAIVVAIAAFFLIRKNGNDTNGFDRYTVARGDISEYIVAGGNVSTDGSAAVYSPSTGIIAAVLIANGDEVTEGQELFRVQSTATDIEKANALSAYRTAQAALNAASQAKLTNQSLLEAGRKSVIDASLAVQTMTTRRNTGSVNPATGAPYTQDEIDAIQSTYTSTQQSFSALEKKYLDSDAAIASANASKNAAWYSYQASLNGVIRAPIAGTITNLSVGVGEAVTGISSSLAVSSSVSPVLQIRTKSDMTVTVKLSETDIAKIKPGLTSTVVFDALPGKKFDATVVRLDDIGDIENARVTYRAYVVMANGDLRIRPGMTAEVTIITESKKDVLVIPNAALTREDAKTMVRVPSDRGYVLREVITGVKNTTWTEVADGLTEGETVLSVASSITAPDTAQ